jgi:hypothetical protein
VGKTPRRAGEHATRSHTSTRGAPHRYGLMPVGAPDPAIAGRTSSRQAAWQDVGEREHAARFPPPLRRVTDEHETRGVPRGALGEPRFLDLHAPHAADGTGIRAGGWRGRRGNRVQRRARLGGCQEGLPEDLSTSWELDLALPIRQEPIVPHPLEATRQDMQEKAPNAFDGVKRHEVLTIASLVILPPERHLAIVTGEEPSMRDGHPMRGAGQVAQDPLRPGQRRLGVDHPLRLLQGRQSVTGARQQGRANGGPAPAY